ncbi:MAG: hypothetical protein ACYC67_14235 [Prosthecobacter sp.]
MRLLLGGMIAAGLVLLFGRHAPAAPSADIWARCGSSLLALALALLLALCIGVFVGLRARQMGPRMERFIALLGRALACVPVVALVWGFIGGWIGRLGWPVESLMPAQFPDGQDSRQVLLAHVLWEFLAPALILALPLCGEMIHAVIMSGSSVLDLDFSLRARGVPKASRLWLHHLSQLRPLLRVRLQSLCLIAPVYLIIIEDALHFMGWGGWMAHSLRTGDAPGIALGFASAGAMLALLCTCLHLLPGRLKSAGGSVATLAWQPWLLWALGLLALLPSSVIAWIILWMAVLLSGCAGWHQAWNRIEANLPVDAARVCGATDSMIWRNHIAFVLFRMLTAWLCTVLAHTLLGMAAACALLPRLIDALSAPLAKIYRPLATASAQSAMQTLADPTALIQSGACIALAALCLIQVSRIVQPRLS